MRQLASLLSNLKNIIACFCVLFYSNSITQLQHLENLTVLLGYITMEVGLRQRQLKNE